MYATTWMNLEDITLSEMSQKDKYCMITYNICIVYDYTYIQTHRNRIVVVRGWGEGEVYYTL